MIDVIFNMRYKSSTLINRVHMKQVDKSLSKTENKT